MTMEILSNFASIYCYIAFVIGAVFMLAIYSIEAMGKSKEPRNKVHFYVTCEKNIISGKLTRALWIGLPKRNSQGGWASSSWGNILAVDGTLLLYNLCLSNFENMKDGEIREVFLNLED